MSKNKLLLFLFLGFLAGACFANQLPAVPTANIDFDVDVSVWWYQHPFNPEGPNYTPDIASPTHTVNLSPGSSIGNAIANLPASGGTIILAQGTYAGDFNIIGQDNVHIIAPNGAVIDISQNAIDHNCVIIIAKCEASIDYGQYNLLFKWRDPDALYCWNNPIKNIYFKGITFEGGGTQRRPIWIKTSDGVMLDQCVFQNFWNPGTGHSGLINGHAGADSVWVRDSHFVGNQRWAIYIDGGYGFGMINCTIDSNFNNGILWLCNEDFTMDWNNDGVFSKEEKRNMQYAVVYGTHFAGGIHTGIAGTGNDLMVRNNTVGGYVSNFATFNPKTSLINEDVVHYCYDLFIENNLVTSNIGTFAHFNSDLDEVYPGWSNKSRLGKYTVRGNALNASYTETILHTGVIDGPNVACGNCWNDPGCTPDGTCGGTTPPPGPEPAGDMISVNFGFGATDITGTAGAGAYSTINWNNATGSATGTLNGLVDSDGVATGVNLSWASNEIWHRGDTPSNDDDRLMKSFLNHRPPNNDRSLNSSDPSTVTLTGLPAGNYSLIIYSDGDEDNIGRVTVFNVNDGSGVVTKTANDVVQYPVDGYLDDSGLDYRVTSNANDYGNYLVFDNLSGSTLTIEFHGLDDVSWRGHLNGLQVAFVESTVDTEPPTVPQNLAVTGTTTTSVSLSWDASTDNVGVAGYEVYRDSAYIGSTSNTSYTDTGLVADTTYTYAVLAYDAADNASALSNSINATTDSETTEPAGGIISVNFGFGATDITGTAGVGAYSTNNWNNATGSASGTLSGLVDSDGVVTGVGLSWASNEIWHRSDTAADDNARLMKSFLNHKPYNNDRSLNSQYPSTVTLNGLPTGTYSLVIYTDGDEDNIDRVTVFDVNDGSGVVTKMANDVVQYPVDGYLADSGLDYRVTSSSADYGNYIVFDNLSGSTLTIEFHGLDNVSWRGHLNGLQVIPDPEPATQEVISVNFGFGATDIAGTAGVGAYSTNNWNNATGSASGTLSALVDSAGVATGASINWSSNEIWHRSDTAADDNARLMKSFLNHKPYNNDRSLNSQYPSTVTLNGLPTGTYSLVIYTDGDEDNIDRVTVFDVNDGSGVVTKMANDVVQYPVDGYLADSGLDYRVTSNANDLGNYLVFDNLSGTTLTIEFYGQDNVSWRGHLNGLQVIYLQQ